LNPNASAVAKQLGGIGRPTVIAIAREAGVALAEKNLAKTKRLSPEKRAQIIEALEADPTASKVAPQFGGVSARTVQEIAKKAGSSYLPVALTTGAPRSRQNGRLP
jgi:hypothetical protein